MSVGLGHTQVIPAAGLVAVGGLALVYTFEKMVRELEQGARDEGVAIDWLSVKVDIEPWRLFKEWEVDGAVAVRGLEFRLRVNGD